MRESKAANVKFWVVAVVTLVVAALGLAALVPATRSAAQSESTTLTTAGSQASGAEAEADYRLAAWLNPSNQTAFVGLAQTQIAAGQPSLAAGTLSRAGQGSAVAGLRVRTLIELGRDTDAAAAATNLTGPAASQSDLVLAGLAYALAGRPTDTDALAPRLTSPQAATSISRAQSGKLTLAAALYANGLLNSSNALLTPLPESFERNLLLAHILYARHTTADLAQAANLLADAVATNPVDLESRQLLQSVYHDQSNAAAATQQAALITRLQTGRP